MNKVQAVHWFKMAAEQGLAAAQYFLGNSYYKGEGVAIDKQKAILWLTKAAKQGLVDAQKSLQVIYDEY